MTQPGLGGILEYLKQAYGDIPIYIHENGSSSLSLSLMLRISEPFESWFRGFFCKKVWESSIQSIFQVKWQDEMVR